MKRVVTDTGPILHLHEADALYLLRFVGNIQIPTAVEEEIDCLTGIESIKKVIGLTTILLIHPYDMQAESWLHTGILDRGEAHAIALDQQIEADWFLTDDASARFVARSVQIEVHGSLGIVLWAAATGNLSLIQAEATLNRLAESSLWITSQLLEEARHCLKEMYE